MYSGPGHKTAPKQEEATTSAFTVAAASEGLAGKAKQEGVENLDGKLARSGGGESDAVKPADAVKSMPNAGSVQTVMTEQP